MLKNDWMKLFDEFFGSGILNKNVNETYLCLIPKKARVTKVADCRSISLVTCVYEVVAKVLAHRLRKVMHHTIS